MEIKRNLLTRLVKWAAQTKHKPLIIRGARQVGKTHTVREFARIYKLDFIELNFEKQKELLTIFEKNLDPKRIIIEIELFFSRKVVPGKTLLFFDEIQDCPKAIESLRYFYEDIAELHVISAGSMLEFVMSELSVPVGRVHYEYAYPCSFSEYVETRQNLEITEFLPRLENDEISFNKSTPVTVKQKLASALKEYFLIGGMPEAISTFINTNSLLEARMTHQDILTTFKEDVSKYGIKGQQLESLTRLFPQLFKYVGKQIKYTEIGQGDSTVRTKTSLHLLELALLIKKVTSVHAVGLPLNATSNEKIFKLLYLDIGLGQTLSGYEAKSLLKAKNLLDSYQGQLAEQFVGQQLLSESKTANIFQELFCWIRSERGSSAEVDYLIQREGKIIPVEVKSGRGGRLKSMSIFRDQYKSPFGICLQDIDSPYFDKGVWYTPLYTIL